LPTINEEMAAGHFFGLFFGIRHAQGNLMVTVVVSLLDEGGTNRQADERMENFFSLTIFGEITAAFAIIDAEK
jgi:hypothetical protein